MSRRGAVLAVPAPGRAAVVGRIQAADGMPVGWFDAPAPRPTPVMPGAVRVRDLLAVAIGRGLARALVFGRPPVVSTPAPSAPRASAPAASTPAASTPVPTPTVARPPVVRPMVDRARVRARLQLVRGGPDAS